MLALRKTERPSLRDRLRSLKGYAARYVPSRSRSLPEAGSEQAMAACRAACQEHSRLTPPTYPGWDALKRTPLEWWTTETVEQAVERGEISPTDGARLYAAAARRQLVIDHASVATNVGALHILAFADEYPQPLDTEDEPDPVFGRIATARAATRAATEVLPGDAAPFGTPEALAAEEETRRRSAAQDTAFRAVFQTPPKTRKGLFALLDYAREREGFYVEMASDDQDPPDVLGVIRAALNGLLDDVPEPDDPDAEATTLVETIEREWAIFAREERAEMDRPDEGADERGAALLDRRDGLIEAANRLDGSTRANRHAKALVLAWIAWVDDHRPGQDRERYTPWERLSVDIEIGISAALRDGTRTEA